MLTAVHKKHSVILVRHYAANGPDMRAFEIRAGEIHATPIRGHRCRSSLSTRGDEPAQSKTGVSQRQTGMLGLVESRRRRSGRFWQSGHSTRSRRLRYEKASPRQGLLVRVAV
jgi:hypothetical protein